MKKKAILKLTTALGLGVALLGEASLATNVSPRTVQAKTKSKNSKKLYFTNAGYIYNRQLKPLKKVKKGTVMAYSKEVNINKKSRKFATNVFLKVKGGYVSIQDTLPLQVRNILQKGKTNKKNKLAKVSPLTESQITSARSRFLEDVNNWNTEKGRKSFTLSSDLQSVSQKRAEQNAKLYREKGELSHFLSDGTPAIEAPEFQKSGQTLSTEVIGMVTRYGKYKTLNKAVDRIFDNFIYHDAASGWGHRKALTQGELTDDTQIGIGVAQVKRGKYNALIIVANTGKAQN